MKSLPSKHMKENSKQILQAMLKVKDNPKVNLYLHWAHFINFYKMPIINNTQS